MRIGSDLSLQSPLHEVFAFIQADIPQAKSRETTWAVFAKSTV